MSSLYDIEVVYCIKEFTFDDKRGIPCTFKVGEKYDYWQNFGGLNHFVRYSKYATYPFDGDQQVKDGVTSLGRPYIFDYFQLKDEHRESQLSKIGI
jgi:hypothetical protein